MSIDVRRERPAEAAAARRVVASAFARGAGDPAEPLEAGLLDRLRGDPAWIHSGWVGVLDRTVVAQVTVVPVRVGGAPAHALGIVSVLPEHQGKGYGTSVTWGAIRHLIEQRASLAVVLGSPEFYGRFGFVPAPVVGVDGGRYPAPFMQALALRVGHPRGLVEYPPPYRDLDE